MCGQGVYHILGNRKEVSEVEKNNQCLRRIGKRKTDSGRPGKKLIHEDLINQTRRRFKLNSEKHQSYFIKFRNINHS